jgi:L-arabinonolactonase
LRNLTTSDVSCVLDAKALVGEGALWCALSQRLLWVDVWERELHRYDPVSGCDERWVMPEMIGCAAPMGADAVMLGMESGFFTFVPSTQALLPHSLLKHGSRNRCNDSVVDPTGRLWCATMNLLGLRGPATGELYALGADGMPVCHLRDLHLGNGLACAPDGTILYLSDSHPSVNRVWRCSMDPDSGALGERELFFDFAGQPGRPDGATVDVDGCYWICAVDGWEVLRITPQGRIDRRIALPVAKPSKLAFGGARLDTLFITSISAGIAPEALREQPLAGGVFAVHVGPIGLPSAQLRPHPGG